MPKQTRGWDDVKAKVTAAQRDKEESSDYRYFPEPDLVPVTVTDARSASKFAGALVELPTQIRERLEATYKIPRYDSDVIVSQGRDCVDYYEELAELSGDGKRASNLVQQDVLRTLNEQNIALDSSPFVRRPWPSW